MFLVGRWNQQSQSSLEDRVQFAGRKAKPVPRRRWHEVVFIVQRIVSVTLLARVGRRQCSPSVGTAVFVGSEGSVWFAGREAGQGLVVASQGQSQSIAGGWCPGLSLELIDS